MKKLVTFAVIFLITATTLTLCRKETKEPKKMNGIEFTAKYGVKLPFLDYGDEETTSPSNSNKGKKPKAADANIAVWEENLSLSFSGGVWTTTVSPNAQCGAITRFATTTSNDGAFTPTGCNWNWNSVADDHSPRSCIDDNGGSHRSFTSDFPVTDTDGNQLYVVHVSSFQ